LLVAGSDCARFSDANPALNFNQQPDMQGTRTGASLTRLHQSSIVGTGFFSCHGPSTCVVSVPRLSQLNPIRLVFSAKVKTRTRHVPRHAVAIIPTEDLCKRNLMVVRMGPKLAFGETSRWPHHVQAHVQPHRLCLDSGAVNMADLTKISHRLSPKFCPALYLFR
jgi:hypothetical protein